MGYIITDSITIRWVYDRRAVRRAMSGLAGLVQVRRVNPDGTVGDLVDLDYRAV